MGDLIDRIETSTPTLPPPTCAISSWPIGRPSSLPRSFPGRNAPSRTGSRAASSRRETTSPSWRYTSGAEAHASHGFTTTAGTLTRSSCSSTATRNTWPSRRTRGGSCTRWGGREINKSQITDAVDLDLEKFPLFDRARGIRFQLHPDETLFVPAGWWHTAGVHRDAQRGAGNLGPVRAVVGRARDVITARPENYRGE